jgi:outer membrane protein assembly factor BamB
MQRRNGLGIWVVCVVAAWAATTGAAEPAQRRFITADSSKGRAAIIDQQGRTEWETRIGPLHDLHVLDNGHVLLQVNWTKLVELDPASGKVVWEYDSAKQNGNAGRAIEVHAFQRLDNGVTLIAESGVSRLIEVDAAGKIVHQMPLKVARSDPHRDTRLVRKLASGNYLVCHEADAVVREYAPDGAIVWEYAVPLFGKPRAGGHGIEAFGNQCFAAVRLANGHTLLSTGNGHSVLEVTPEKEIVWQLEQRDLPGITLAWVTTLQVLPSGNIVIGNCHAGPDNPQVIEITRDKQVVWSFHDFERFGDATTNTQMLAVDGQAVRAQPGRDR